MLERLLIPQMYLPSYHGARPQPSAALADENDDTIDLRDYVASRGTVPKKKAAAPTEAIRLSVRHFAKFTEPVIYQFTMPCIRLGRASDNDVVMATPLPVMSRHHAEFYWSGQGYWLRDLGSKRGTRCNGEQVAQDEPVLLHDGDEVQLGHFVLRFEHVSPC